MCVLTEIVVRSWLELSKARERVDEWPVRWYRTSELISEAVLLAGNKTKKFMCVLTEIVVRSWLELSKARERVDEWPVRWYRTSELRYS